MRYEHKTSYDYLHVLNKNPIRLLSYFYNLANAQGMRNDNNRLGNKAIKEPGKTIYLRL